MILGAADLIFCIRSLKNLNLFSKAIIYSIYVCYTCKLKSKMNSIFFCANRNELKCILNSNIDCTFKKILREKSSVSTLLYMQKIITNIPRRTVPRPALIFSERLGGCRDLRDRLNGRDKFPSFSYTEKIENRMS